ncbi:MAG: hypothetical protein FRX49_02684 [Trebouxia sp. A1-2]|nr:MAG: hypothetical protein FRX49_02684 [Trebouxia sp. A1-2]
MISTDKEPLFFGDMRQFMPQGCSFSDFLSTADGLHSLSASRGPAQTSHSLVQAYLAQASLDAGHPLEALQKDFEVPDVISHADLVHTNLWMSIRGSRSSLHYDPYHNLLCMVQGQKTVKLLSPDVTDQLYPFSVLGESPNHSHVNFAHPDDQQHPLYKQALQSQQEFVLQAGDALFIPEGWWHQVDSQDTTIAVNFWWQSALTKSMQPHMHQYYLRHLLDSLLDSRRQQALASVLPQPHLQAFQHSVDASCVQPHTLDASSGQSDTTSSSSAISERSDSAAPSVLTSGADLPEPSTAAVKALSEPTTECPQPSLQPQPILEPVDEELQSVDAAVQAALPAAVRLHAQASNDTLQNQHRYHQKRKAADMYTAATEDIEHPSADIDDLPNAPRQQAGEPDMVQSEHRHCRTRMVESAIDTTASDLPVAGTADSAVHSASTERRMSFHLTAVQLLAAAVADSLDTDNKSGQMSTGLDDPITCILAALPPQAVQSVLSLMSHRVPRTLEALLMHALPPAAAELLTQKLEQADSQGGAGQQQFYADLYGVTPDPQKALHVLLDKKEAFSRQICNQLMSCLLAHSFPNYTANA